MGDGKALSLIEKLLLEPQISKLSDLSYDSIPYVEANRKIIASKEILQFLYNGYCEPFVESSLECSKDAIILEIGSGHGYLKEKIPTLITSDYVKWPWVDRVIDAKKLPFSDNSLERIFLMFVFHHLEGIESFLDEAYRCLKTGGEIIILDPAINFFSKQYYKVHPDNINLHQKKWSVFENNNDSNIALAWTVFVRDREIFLEKYPLFEIESIKYNTCITYLLSGGFRLRPLLPTKVLRIINQFENWIIKRITNKIAVSMVVKVIKK